MANYCKTCGAQVHPKRVALGYPDTCPEHSTASRYAGFIAADGKSDYAINIVRDPEAAKHVQRLMGMRGQDA